MPDLARNPLDQIQPGMSYFEGSCVKETACTLFTSADISAFDSLAFEVVQIGGTTPAIKVYPSFDGTNYSAMALALLDLGAVNLMSALVAATALGNYLVASPIKVKRLRIDYTAATPGRAQIRGSIWKR